MLNGGFKESSDEIVRLDYSFLDEVALMTMIDYIYTGQIQVSKTSDIEELESLIQVSDYFELNDITKWLLHNVISSLTQSNMKNIFYIFDKFDSEGIIRKEIKRELKAFWINREEDFFDDWEFILKVWPDLGQKIHIMKYDQFVKIMSILDLNCLPKSFSPSCLELRPSLIDDILDKDPDMYFRYEVKYRGVPDCAWILNFLINNATHQDKVLNALKGIYHYLKIEETNSAQGYRKSERNIILDSKFIKQFRSSLEIQRLMNKILLILNPNITLFLEIG